MQTLRFTATWCQPCKAMQPIIDWARAEGYNIRDVEMTDPDNDRLVEQYRITSVPTFILLQDGKEIRRQTGAMTKNRLVEFLDA